MKAKLYYLVRFYKGDFLAIPVDENLLVALISAQLC